MLSYWRHVRYVLCRNAADLPALQAALDGTATSLPELQQGAYAGGNTAGEKAAFLWERVPLLLPEGFERSGADGSAEFEMPQVRLCVHTLPHTHTHTHTHTQRQAGTRRHHCCGRAERICRAQERPGWLTNTTRAVLGCFSFGTGITRRSVARYHLRLVFVVL